MNPEQNKKKLSSMDEILNPQKKSDPRGPWFGELDPTKVPDRKKPFPTTLIILVIIIIALIASAVFIYFASAVA